MQNDTAVETWTCGHCGTHCERAKVRGQKPRWCSIRCRDLALKATPGTCAHCGKQYRGHGARYCSPRCVGDSRKKTPEPKAARTPVDLRSPIRRAYEDSQWAEVANELRLRVEVDSDGCWIWQGQVKDGYAVVRVGTRELFAHRVSVEAQFGKRLGSQPVHHKCAHRTCINPEHLEPVTHAENIIEMLARNAYIARIRELEDALAVADPKHPALAVLPLL